MLQKKMWRTMGLYKAQFISMIIMVALGIGIFVGFNMEWFSIQENTRSFFKETGFSDYRIVSDLGFSGEDLDKIKKIDGVMDASRYVSINADVVEKKGDSVALTVTENEKVSGFILLKGKEYNKNSEDGIWLSDKYADANKVEIGDKLTFVYNGTPITGKVKGLIKSGEHTVCVRDGNQVMPDYKTHGFAYISPVLYENSVGRAFYPQVNVLSQKEKKKITEDVNEALGKSTLIQPKEDAVSYAGAQGEIKEGKAMGAIFPVLFLLIAILTMVTTMHRLTAKEKIQIGTLKALGFKDRRITRHYTSYALMVGVIGAALGIAIGYRMARFIMNPAGTMGTYLDMPRWDLA
ncbi:MAG: ABC transporter permease, partial [Anaerovoracaceae bacterium]